MNESNIAYSILSLQCPGIGAVTDKKKAEDTARAVNDALAEKISEHPDRFGGFASLAVHDGDKAAKELERCIKKLGFKGVLFNGYSQVDRDDTSSTSMRTAAPRSGRPCRNSTCPSTCTRAPHTNSCYIKGTRS
jgi:predicted TIM-barrel fold metal-dependent hydrolase